LFIRLTFPLACGVQSGRLHPPPSSGQGVRKINSPADSVKKYATAARHQRTWPSWVELGIRVYGIWGAQVGGWLCSLSQEDTVDCTASGWQALNVFVALETGQCVMHTNEHMTQLERSAAIEECSGSENLRQVGSWELRSASWHRWMPYPRCRVPAALRGPRKQ